MHSKTSSLCLFSTVIAITVLGLSWLLAYKYRLVTYNPGSYERCQLVVGILSARGNAKQRHAIRDTWFPRRTDARYCVRAFFVIGQDSCPIPPEDRLDEYDCKLWDVDLNEVGDAKTVHFSSTAVPSTTSRPVSMGLRFQVQHSIIVTKLGVLGSIVKSGKPVSAILQITANQEEVARVTLSSHNVGTAANGYLYRPIEHLLLPKDFEGSIFLSEADHVPNLKKQQAITYNNGSGILSFQHTIAETGMEQAFDINFITAVSFGFTVYDLQALEVHVRQQPMREENWRAKLHEEDSSLRDEMLKHNDLLIVNAMDFYRNLPLKLLLFYEWVQEHYDFDYLLKVDDDSVLNIDNVTNFLKSTSIDFRKKIWWGRFRYNWLVQRAGKWREANFGSVVYPPFACGVASVMSSDLIHWAAGNRRELYKYQGEDVSVGIWLSALAPTYIHDTSWQCDAGCQKDALSRGQLDPNEIRHSWTTFIQCGQFCSCDL